MTHPRHEYQDTNHAQYRLIRALADRHHSITVVGDSDQSIYSWRGADISNILDFERDFPEARTIRLEQNYRSTQTILDGANAVIACNRDRQEKELWSDLGAGEAIQIVECADERSEARYVVGQIARIVGEGGSLRNALSALTRSPRDGGGPRRRTSVSDNRRAGLDRGGEGRAPYLRAIANPADDVSLRRIINVPARIGDTPCRACQQRHAGIGLRAPTATRCPRGAARRRASPIAAGA